MATSLLIASSKGQTVADAKKSPLGIALEQFLDEERLSGGRSGDTSIVMADTPTRPELDAKLAAAHANVETQFEKLRSDIRELRAATIGKTTFFLGLIAFFAATVAVLAYAGQWFGLGLQSHDALVAAAREGARQALAAKP